MPTALLPNFFSGRWQNSTGAGTPMFDPVLGNELTRVFNPGVDLAEGVAFARKQGGASLRALSNGQSAALQANNTLDNPRNETVRMGALVSQEQKASELAGLAQIEIEATVLLDGSAAGLVDNGTHSARVARCCWAQSQP